MRRLLLSLGLLTALLVPASASATTVVKVVKDGYGGDLLWFEGDADPSQIAIALAPVGKGSTITLTDGGGRLVASRNCTRVDDGTITCTNASPHLETRGDLGAGDDAITLPGETEGIGFDEVILHLGAGNDRYDGIALTPKTTWVEMEGEAGDDVLLGGTGRDRLFGEAGNDTVHGGAGDDLVIGDDGIDDVTGDDGNDVVDGDGADTVFDGGAGDDIMEGLGVFTPVCGVGTDNVALEPGESIGPVLDAACERVVVYQPLAGAKEGVVGDAHPAVDGRTLTFTVKCAEKRKRCRAKLQLRWKGRLVAARAFSSNRKPVAVRLKVPAELVTALAAGQEVLALSIKGFVSKSEVFDEPDVRSRYSWRVQAGTAPPQR